MDSLKPLFVNHKRCVVYFPESARTNLRTVATLIAIREAVKKLGASCTFERVAGRTHFDEMSESDWTTVYCYLVDKKDKSVLHYSYYDNEHVRGACKIDYTDSFPPQDAGAIDESRTHKRLKNISLENLWVMTSPNPDNKLIKAMISDRLIQHYHKRHGLTDSLIDNALPNVFSIYLHTIDYLKRHRLNIFMKKNVPQSSKFKMKGAVVTVNQTNNTDKNYLDMGFKRFPEAEFIINYWNNGIMQLQSNKDTNNKTVDMSHAYDLLMEDWGDKLEKKIIPLSTIKWVLEDINNPLITLDFNDILSLKPHMYYATRSTTNHVLANREAYITSYEEFTDEIWEELDAVGISLYDLLELTTERSEDLMTITAFLFYGKSHRPNKAHKLFSIERGVKLSAIIRNKLVGLLNKQSDFKEQSEPHLQP
jgi:hypothetical protein